MVTSVVIKFEWTPMKIVGEIAAYGPVLRKISKCHKFCKFWQMAKKSDSLYDYDTLHKLWMNRMNILRGDEFLKIVKLEILQSAPNDPESNPRNRASKVLTTICAL